MNPYHYAARRVEVCNSSHSAKLQLQTVTAVIRQCMLTVFLEHCRADQLHALNASLNVLV